MSLILETVVPTDEQINILYDQLIKRTHRISHKIIPTLDEHINFVIDNPYRAWFIVRDLNCIIGNVYVQFDNSIGLNCLDDIKESQLSDILYEISTKLAPLEGRPSIRYEGYFLNVSSSNVSLQKKLSNLGLIETQRTYAFDVDID